MCFVVTIEFVTFATCFEKMNYQKLNVIFGWLTWVIATYVFCSTIEPTASFWDCGEFIASAVKLEVGHPPGAPFFMLIGRVFSIFVSPENAAKMINISSALCSSFTILFLFWTVTALAKKIALLSGELTPAKTMAIIGSGIVGGLAYTFSDSFWFSAVEGEVYAMSSLFTAVVFWSILKWEAAADEPLANRWLVFICYLMGLSIGVHLLNLLAIPAIAFVYYFKKHKVTQKGLLWVLMTAVLILGVIQAGIIPWTIKLAGAFELFFVNKIELPFNSGLYIYVLLLTALFVFLLKHTHKPLKNNAHLIALLLLFFLIPILGNEFLSGGGKFLLTIFFIGVGAFVYWLKKPSPSANTIILCFTVILLGYSSFAMILIRSSANPPMDENNPENAFTLLSYINREQYGDRPLLKGHFFNSPLDNQEPYVDGSPVWFQDKEKGKYIVSDDKKNSIPNYAKEFTSWFPRMYSSDSKHVREYKKWSDFEGKKIRYRAYGSSEVKPIPKPTLLENVTFFVRYQIGWMYFRYFMWNFSGRQNDVQGHGNFMDGNWLSGIDFIDENFAGVTGLGPQSDLPDDLKNNPARNQFYLLPLILGLIGFFFQLSKSKKDMLVVGLLFFFTGIAISIYLNQYPIQPRERDYAYSGSFYAYTIWIGLGVLALFEILRKYIPEILSAGLVTLICLTAVPGIMAKEGWDDHNRSDTYTARDFAKNYLRSCEKNAILFTNGDNDTFPLWYVQEVEEFRTDVRVCNLSLLNTDWYINQMRRKAYDSEPVPFGMPPEKYRQGTRDYVPVIKKIKKSVDIKDAINFISDEKQKALLGSNRRMNYFPTNKFSVSVDSAKVVDNGTVPKHLVSEMEDKVSWSIGKSYILKNDMMIMDLLANNDWERPIYFAITTGNSAYIGLQNHFQLEGLAYRLIPVRKDKCTKCETGFKWGYEGDCVFKDKNQCRAINGVDGQTGILNTEIMFENLINEFTWGGMEAKDLVNYTVQEGDSTESIAEKLGISKLDLVFSNKEIDFNALEAGAALEIKLPHWIYMNENNRRMCMNLRNNFSRLAEALIKEKKKDKAIITLDRCMEVMPEKTVPYNFFMLPVAEAYFRAGDKEKGGLIISQLFNVYEKEINYYLSVNQELYNSISNSRMKQSMSILYRVNELVARNIKGKKKEFKERFDALQQAFAQKEAGKG